MADVKLFYNETNYNENPRVNCNTLSTLHAHAPDLVSSDMERIPTSFKIISYINQEFKFSNLNAQVVQQIPHPASVVPTLFSGAITPSGYHKAMFYYTCQVDQVHCRGRRGCHFLTTFLTVTFTE